MGSVLVGHAHTPMNHGDTEESDAAEPRWQHAGRTGLGRNC